MPAIQLALDTRDTQTAVAAAHATRDVVDVIEAGTVLVLHEGLGAVRVLRAAFPDHPLVADIRIARAGAKFAALAFDAGADRVTVVGEAGMHVVEGALSAARSAGGEVEVELGAGWTLDDVGRWVDAGVRHVIAHRSGNGLLRDDDEIARTLEQLASIDLGPAQVTLAGGIDAGDLAETRLPFDTVAIGSAIVGAADPRAAASAFRAELARAREVRVA
ncbi:orotidine 5'-phosphate decarboxylase [Actinotalea ferrariae]|uniref:orotidine 5'-phosphate decarboxylase / HUMPS family protein n=1 Tax=Actinotalea ferrariae TaxID=1386098 RepID=UPI001C8CC13A|nr:orotidine 5'-phosphate decarboxylase / HUMPS family protein [Actinotalea ferrariae]MBX9244149.1 orotidine 5'-phosphate decarboxylase [Actinotalea ferrariae]